MNPTKLEIIKSAVILYLLVMGAWQTGWNVFCFVRPDATVFKNLKGMPARDKAYMEAYLDACSMGNWFENKITKCAVSGASLATLIKGEAVVAQIGLDALPLSDERKSWESQAEAAEIPAGNVQSPAN